MSKMNNKTKHRIVFTVILSFLAIILCGLLFITRMYFTGVSAPSKEDREVGFVIEEGLYGDRLIDKLYQEGLIRDKNMCDIWVFINEPSNVYAGNYILNTNMSVREIYDVITHQENAIIDEVTCQFIPGNWAEKIAHIISDNTNLTFQEIWEVWTGSTKEGLDYIYSLVDKYEFLTEDIFNSEHCYLEGYLFPDTYRFYKTTTVKQVTEKILDRTNQIYQKYASQIKNSKYSVSELFTLASILQFESGNNDDIYLISSVFHNRLDKKGVDVAKGYLQSSVTICYALYNYENGAECEYYENQSIDSKYNTYLYPGLPIGPICNMTEKCLDAAISPQESDYLYFVGANGRTYFAKTFSEHEANIKKYLH